jgi:hypothetical protein
MSRRGLGLVACLVVLSACARPEALTVSSPAENTTTKLAPDVPLSLDISSYASAPCTLLKADQTVAQDLGEGTAQGATCTWHAKTPQQPEMTATVDTRSGGLEGLYRKRSQLPYFEPSNIDGFPAVRYDTDRSVPDQGRCTVSVGVSDDSVITVTSAIADSKTLNYPVPCPDTEVFATALVAGVRKG